MSTVSTQAIAGMGPLQLLAWYRQHKDQLAQFEGYVTEWQAITEQADSEAGLQKRVELALKAAKTIAQLTGNATAEQVLDTVAAIIDNPALLGVFAKMISPLIHAKAPVAPADPNAAPPAVIKPLSFEQLSDHREQVKALGFDFSKLADLVPLISEIIKLFAEAAP